MKRTIYFSLVLLLCISLLISCNLDGSGLFIDMTQAVKSTNTDFSDFPVDRIINKDGTAMYLQTGLSIKCKEDITDADEIWEDIGDFSGKVNSAVYDNANSKYYIALSDEDPSTTSVYEFSTLTKDTNITDGSPILSGKNIASLFKDAANAFALYKDGSAIKVINLNGSSETIIPSSTADTPVSNSFAVSDGSNHSHLFINIFADGDYKTYYCTYDGSVFTAVELIADKYFIGGVVFGSDIYLYTSDGEILRYPVADPIDFSTATPVSILESESELSIMNKQRTSGIPTVLVTDTDTYALIAGDGDSLLYKINLTAAATALEGGITPEKVTDDPYYNTLNHPITDFYDSDETDWAFYAATSDSFVMEVTDKDSHAEGL